MLAYKEVVNVAKRDNSTDPKREKKLAIYVEKFINDVFVGLLIVN